MRFWDSSAVVPLLLPQPLTPRARALHDEDPDVVVWWGTPVECASAFARLRREGSLDHGDELELSARLERLRLGWHEVVPSDRLRAQALRALRMHALRAGDALQLAAALEWSGGSPSAAIVTFDTRLADASRLEGFGALGAA